MSVLYFTVTVCAHKYLMQYKFLVDGVWRDNDLQDFGEDEYGNIGNYILIEPQSMDIDNNLGNPPDEVRIKTNLYLSVCLSPFTIASCIFDSMYWNCITIVCFVISISHHHLVAEM